MGGLDKYSFVDSITINPTNTSRGSTVTMTCNLTSSSISADNVKLYYTNGSNQMMFNESDCGGSNNYDAMTFNTSGSYNWTKMEVKSSEGYSSIYLPNGDVKDLDNTVFTTHDFNFPNIVITD